MAMGVDFLQPVSRSPWSSEESESRRAYIEAEYEANESWLLRYKGQLDGSHNLEKDELDQLQYHIALCEQGIARYERHYEQFLQFHEESEKFVRELEKKK